MKDNCYIVQVFDRNPNVDSGCLRTDFSTMVLEQASDSEAVASLAGIFCACRWYRILRVGSTTEVVYASYR